MNEFYQQALDAGFEFSLVLCGLAIFLFGVKTMGDSLKVIAGSRMKHVIDKFTTNPVMGVFVGAFVTGLLQSSSGTTALTISLVRAGLMNLRQAVGIIMGANIGTTVTAILIGFKISAYSPYILIVGAVMLMFSVKTKWHHVALFIFSFGSLFYGLSLMGGALKTLSHMPMFYDFVENLTEHKLLGVLLGAGMTITIQSSSATIGILQTVYAEGLIPLDAALPVLFGDNIGTTITAVLASIGGSVAAKRAAAAHVTFNVIGTVIFMLLFPFFLSFVQYVSDARSLNPEMQIAFAHATFNISTTILLLPFIGIMVSFVTWLIRDKNNEEDVERVILDEKLLEVSPIDAITAAYENALSMSELCKKMSVRTQQYVFDRDFKSRDRAYVYEEIINDYNKDISKYLIKIGESELDEENIKLQSSLLYCVKDLERVGDHFINLINQFDTIFEAKENLSEQAILEISKMFVKVDELIDLTSKIIHEFDLESVEKITNLEDELDVLNDEFKEAFIARFRSGEQSDKIISTLYVDMLSELERVGDHCENIALRIKKSQ